MKTLAVSLLSLVALSFLPFLPHRARAIETGFPYGGLTSALFPCTCSAGFVLTETPLFLGTDVPVSGTVYYPPGAPILGFFQLLSPGTFDLGALGPYDGECLMLAPDPADPCIIWPAVGTIEYAGSSSLSPSPY